VFYLSYLGADPRDGSVREPSVLVSELIDAAAAYHLDPAAAVGGFTVRHALQPFSPAAFGDGDPRRFSYRRQWHPAAGRLSGQRGGLPPWFDAPLPPPPEDAVEDEVALDSLRRFLCDPAGQFLAQSLGLRLADEVEEVDDLEPLVLSSRGPEKRSVQAAVVRATLNGDTEPLYPRLRARGLLPSGALGERQFEVEQLKTRPYASALLGWMQGQALESRRYEVNIDGVRLHGRIADRHPEGLVRLRAGTLNGNAVIRQGLDWLLANAAGDALPLVQFHDGGDAGPGPHVQPALSVSAARAALRALLQLRQRGLREPLRFAPYTGWVLYSTAGEKQRSEGWKQWHGSDRSWGESGSDAWQLLLRGADPFATDASYADLLRNSLVVFSAVREGRTLGTDARQEGSE
jgi:exodeoxyribonuclease V gamma subunit